MTLYTRIDDADASDWDGITAGRNIFLNRGYLRALETVHGPVYTALFRLHGRAVGAASFQAAVFQGAPLGGYLQYRCPALALITRSIKSIREPFASTVLVCGSPFTAGEHGYTFEDEVGNEDAAAALVRAAKAVARDMEGRGTGIAGILFKEFSPRARELAGQLHVTRFTEFTTDPAMMLHLDKGWRSFDDYLASLSSKYRVKANREFAKSKNLEGRDLTLADIVTFKERIGVLYGAVAERASYKLGDLNVDTLSAMRAEMDDAFILKGYFLGNSLVGFMMGFENGNSLEAGLVGFDYARNRQHAIYPRMLYDYLKIAFERGLHRVNYGRTASEIKSTLGAVPVPLSCCLRLQKRTLNTVLPLLSGSVRPTPFAWRKPFKQSWYQRNDAVTSAGVFDAAHPPSPKGVLQGGPA